MSDSKHTPTPWQATPLHYSDGPHVPGSFRIDHAGTRQWVASQVRPVDAEFIVRAVNSHDALVEALRIAETLISADIVRDDAGCLAKIRAALAKAGVR